MDMETNPVLEIAGRKVGPGQRVFIIAEMSANHRGDYAEAVEIIHAAAEAGADAVKIQTYTADTMTIDSDAAPFQIKGGLWGGRTLYDLYREAFTPWEWYPRLKEEAEKAGVVLFSSPFDKTAVDFLADMDAPAYKIASFELVDIPLIEYAASKGKPLIISTGMGTLDEITDAVHAARSAGGGGLALLKCTSAYPASPEGLNLMTIPHLAREYDVVAGLSDHTLGVSVPAACVALGACIIEKHFIISRDKGGLDSSFSLEPDEFKDMVEAVRMTEQSLGTVRYGPAESEKGSLAHRRSLFVVKDMKAGEIFTEDNVRSIRPSDGLAPKYLKEVLGKKAGRTIERGEPLSWDMVERG
jgi:pseudaminic acid synthase